MTFTRRGLMVGSAAALARAAAEDSSERVLDGFIASYMQRMFAPGLMLALADRKGTVRTAAYGFSEVETKTPVNTATLFEIGSITKSFVALTLMQLREEGKLELQRPVLEYLPWLPIETRLGTVTVHHLLTHSSGLPDALGLFPSDPAARHVQGFKPGERFHYCNVGFDILGHLIAKLDGRPWPEAVRKRMFEPLEMTSSSAIITNDLRARKARSYIPFHEDRTNVRGARMAAAPNLIFDSAAGSIVSTPGDMARYMRMLARRGEAPKARLVSEESFALFSKRHIEAKVFSPTSAYGYGIAVDVLDGHTLLRHTGGMVSFMSAMMVDLDAGVGAFASINAQLGFRPNPVTQFAVQALRAGAEGKPLPKAPEPPTPMQVKNAGEYAGLYVAPDGRKLEVLAEGERLNLRIGMQIVELQPGGSDRFFAMAPEMQRFPLVFGRAGEGEKAQVVELGVGPDWYANERYSGPKEFAVAPGLAAFPGFYHSESPWFGSTRVVLRKGQLWLDGVTPLTPLSGTVFRAGEEPWNPERAEFLHVAEGKARMMKFGGGDFWRIETP